jgi:hypothetical protein
MTTDHKQSIAALIQFLDLHSHQPLAVNALASRFDVTTRRLYDFINVISAIGACRKSGLDQVIWLGKNQIPSFLQNVCQSRDIDNSQRTLCDLFPVSSCIGISNLTISFLLMFRALRTDHLDLRFVAHLFSRDTRRYKSTLCKLYQISYILGAAGISNRTSQACDVVLLQPDLDFSVLPPDKPEESGPLQIAALLNHRGRDADTEFVSHRRRELQSLFVTNGPPKRAPPG